MNKQQASYRQIMKATSLFGGVQVFQIIIAVVRSKFVAILLGPSGMGIVGLLTSTTGLVAGTPISGWAPARSKIYLKPTQLKTNKGFQKSFQL